MNAYADLLRTPGVARIITAQLLARFPGGMISLGFLLHLEAIFDSYGAAGLVLAATSAGQALSGPLTSRWMGVWGMRPVLILTTAVSTVALLTVALASMPLWGYILAGLIAGLSNPPSAYKVPPPSEALETTQRRSTLPKAFLTWKYCY